MTFRPILFCALLAIPLSAGIAAAFDQADIEKLKEVNRCESCDLSGADLTGVNLAYAELPKADLSHANLAGVQLGQANLSGANLSGADLTGAKLNMANLKEANLSGARLPEARLYRAELDGANLSGADLSDALWVDGKKCGPGSQGKCVPQAKQNEDGKTPSSPKPK